MKDVLNYIIEEKYTVVQKLEVFATVFALFYIIIYGLFFLLIENTLVRGVRENARYLRSKLKEAELNICGNEDSHIIPWILGTVSAVA